MGLLAVYGVPDASTYIYYGLHNLQHRGQEGGGIATFDEKGDSYRYRGLGLLNEIFTNGQIGKLKGSLGIGSVKYSNVSKSGLDNVDPLFFRHKSGDFAIAGEGNIINSRQIADYLEKNGIIFQTDTDSELLAHLVKKTGCLTRLRHHLLDARARTFRLHQVHRTSPGCERNNGHDKDQNAHSAYPVREGTPEQQPVRKRLDI